MDFIVGNHHMKLKLNKALAELKKDAKSAVELLNSFQKDAADAIKNLDTLSSAEIYHRESVRLNTLILKSQNYITEMSCKFQMLKISENNNIKTECEDITTSKTSLEGHMFNSQPGFSFSNGPGTSKDCAIFKTEIPEFGLNTNIPKTTDSQVNTTMPSEAGPALFPEVEIINFGANVKPDIKKENIEFPSLRAISDFQRSGAQCSTAEPSTSANFDICMPAVGKNKGGRIKNRKVLKVRPEVQVPHVAPAPIETQTRALSVNNSQPQLDPPLILDHSEFTDPESRNDQEFHIRPRQVSREPGMEYEVTLENIISPSEFYVVIHDHQIPLFLDLQSKLREHVALGNERTLLTKIQVRARLGSYVLFFARYEETWLRAKVVSWGMQYDDDFIKIFLLDYGELKCVSMYDIDVMPDFCKQYPAFATKCHLHGILPAGFNEELERISWPEEYTEKMTTLTETSPMMRIKIARSDIYHDVDSLGVTLWLPNNVCVNDLLVDGSFGLRGQRVNPAINEEGMNDEELINDIESVDSLNWNPMRIDLESNENCYGLNTNDPASYIYGYVGRDYERMCPLFNMKGTCFKEGTCKKDHERLDDMGFTTDTEEVYRSAFTTLSLPKPLSYARVQITNLVKINKFYCFFDDSRLQGEDEDLRTLQSHLNNPENVVNFKRLAVPPSSGQIVLGQYSEDSCWYRAKIIESEPETDAYQVLYVDYGNRESLSLSSIRAIEARYLHLPFQAVQCYIYGIRQNPEKTWEETSHYLDEKILDGSLTIQVVTKFPGEVVTLMVQVYDKEGRNIGDDLLEKQYALPQREILCSSNSNTIPG